VSKVLELKGMLERHTLASNISYLYDQWQQERYEWLQEKIELRKFLFATDTSKTTNSSLPWKNTTTRPKLTQIRDNLHANYMTALFPSDDWLKWEGYTQEAETLSKKKAITTYLTNKLKLSNFRSTVSQLLYDFIDYGNAIVDVEMMFEYKEDPETGERIPQFVGPRARRISPYDIVFNPLAQSFAETPKITRSIKTMGEVRKDLKSMAGVEHYEQILSKAEEVRRKAHAYTTADWAKAASYRVDGFGSLQEYYQSNYVEILEFEGDIHDPDNNVLLENQIITVIDRSHVIRQEVAPRWLSGSSKAHTGWRKRPDTLWAMGPLDNLVGMQYRIDHLENLSADAMDLAIHPPVVIAGSVEEFDWHPGAEIYAGEGGVVTELGKNLQGVIAAKQDIAALEAKMEELAGSPRETMGIRTPGEKTAFEVQSLMTAASRIFQEKITQFETELLEPLLNSMLEVARRHMDMSDVIRVMDDDFGVVEFMTVTKEDITAEGKIRPVGARHFAAQAQLMQGLVGVFNSPIGQMIQPHTSPKALTKLVEDSLGLERFSLFYDNAMIYENMETQKVMADAEEEVAVHATTPGLEG
jgi:hypothetical protein